MTSQLISNSLLSNVAFPATTTNVVKDFLYVEKTGLVPTNYGYNVEDYIIYVVGMLSHRCGIEDYDPVSNKIKLKNFRKYRLTEKEVDFLFSIMRFVMDDRQLTTRQISYLSRILSPSLLDSLGIDSDAVVSLIDSKTRNGLRETHEKIREVVYIGSNRYCARFSFDESLSRSLKKITEGYCIELGGYIGKISKLTAIDIQFYEKRGFEIENIVKLGRELCQQDPITVYDLEGDNLLAYSNNGSIGKYVNLLIETGNL